MCLSACPGRNLSLLGIPFDGRENILAFYFQREDGSVEGRAYTPRLVRMVSLVGSSGLVDCAELSSLALSKLSLARLWIQGVVHMLGIARNEG